MDNINGIPLVWETQGDNALLGSLMPQVTGNPGQTQGATPVPAAYRSSSRAIWEEMRAGTSYEVATDCDKPFTANFYYGGIHFENLAAFLKKAMHDDCELFNYCDYAKESNLSEFLGNQNTDPFSSGTWSPFPKLSPNTGFKYKNEKGEIVTASLSGRLNTRICYLEEYGCSVKLDAANKVFTGTLRFYYEGTKQFRNDATDTPETGDFRIDDRYVAIELTATSINDFLYLIKEIGGQEDFRFYKGAVSRLYASKIKNTKDSNELKLFYESLPEAIIDDFSLYLDYEVMYSHIVLLTEHDDTGWLSGWRDGSSSLINLLRAMSESVRLYKDLCRDRELVNRVYENLDGTSVFDGVTMSNKTAFTNILKALCAYNDFNGVAKSGTVFYYGPGYGFNANVFSKDDIEKKEHSIFLEQLKETSKYIPEETTKSPNMKYTTKTGGYYEKNTEPMHSGHYGPLDMVYLVDTQNKDSQPIPVPAIYIKSLSDEAEWQDIHQNIRIGADILAVILGIASLGTASPFLLALAYADIALSAADIGVAVFEKKLEETDEGREFLTVWNQVVILGGIATAGPLLVSKIFTSGTKVLRLAKDGKLIAGMQDCLAQVAEKSKNIGNFVNGTKTAVLDISKEFANLDLVTRIKKLQELGVVVLKGELKFTTYQGKGYALVYKGEVIAEGTVKDLIGEVWDIWKKAGKEGGIAKYLDEVAERRITGLTQSETELSKSLTAKTATNIVAQITEDLDELYVAAAIANEELQTLTTNLAKATGGKPGFRPKGTTNGLKERERALEKIAADYEGNAGKLIDIAGSKIVYNTIEELYKALDKIKDKIEIIRFKDRILKPLPNAYRDILINIKMSNGHIVEFRLHLKTMDEAADESHKLYKEVRKLDAIAKARRLTKIEKMKRKALDVQQNKLHSDAWDKIIKMK
ncbi:hypothetical protein AAEO56_17560 [Flavobacterium sp. DGU11]|uniref:RelA/SpoT domain-containing protein n=1 Tax=Flavobacterium arundinis TaxID=3139143 RepID=A0ABU9I1Q4_9FLAO